MTPEEREVLQILGEAWNKFAGLPVLHMADHTEFSAAIHQAQNIVLARPGMRELKEEEGDESS